VHLNKAKKTSDKKQKTKKAQISQTGLEEELEGVYY